MRTIKFKYHDKTLYGDIFEKEDTKRIKDLYFKYENISLGLKNIDIKSTFFVRDIFEIIFCKAYKVIRVKETDNVFSFYSLERLQKINIFFEEDLNKAFKDLNVVKDEMIFYIDFLPNGDVEGNISIFKLDYEVIKKIYERKYLSSLRDNIISNSQVLLDKKINLICDDF